MVVTLRLGASQFVMMVVSSSSSILARSTCEELESALVINCTQEVLDRCNGSWPAVTACATACFASAALALRPPT